jgi:class 3 adenylate cyclase
VTIARRVCDTADQGSVYVSSAVPPLVAGSPIAFADLGEHQLKGVPHPWHLYAVGSNSTRQA